MRKSYLPLLLVIPPLTRRLLFSRLLYRRASRLRRLTGDDRFKSAGEIEGEDMSVREIAQVTLVRPFVLGFSEPIVAFWNAYIALVYSKSR